MTTMKQASHAHYVSVSAGVWLEYIKGLGPKFSFIPDWWPRRQTDLWGSNSWGRMWRILDRPWERRLGIERGGTRWNQRWNFWHEGRKVRAKGTLKRKTAGGKTEVLPQVTLNISLCFFTALSPVLGLGSGLKQWINTWPCFWPYPLPQLPPPD